MTRALSVCSCLGCPACGQRCPELVQHGRCPECRRAADKRRGSGAARGWTSRWARFSRTYLRDNPVCACTNPGCPHPEGCRQPATQVDHIDGTGRTGPRALDPGNAQALCQSCHSRKTTTLDGGFGR